MKKLFAVAVVALLASACSHDYQPKPKGYNRLTLPEPSYQISPDTLPYQFEYSKHARLLKDTSWVKSTYWVEIYYPELEATIHLTYEKINHDEKRLREYLKDAYVLTSKHQIKAYAIDETIVRTPSGMTAVVAELEGEVPSQFQFTMTDSSKNFLRGALYFNVKVQNDSLQPAIVYMKKDVLRLINSVQWK
ncbi:MAG: gliding motility lipoprotein GldD [Cyclobacteriaceae bacterium]|nr:gliding motility lipoprotein GldD [Cyclobacteriaceae bacterium]